MIPTRARWDGLASRWGGLGCLSRCARLGHQARALVGVLGRFFWDLRNLSREGLNLTAIFPTCNLAGDESQHLVVTEIVFGVCSEPEIE
jgi:hypothetical protein